MFAKQHVKITARYKTVAGPPVTLSEQNELSGFTMDADVLDVTASFGPDGGRILSVTVNGKQYKAIVNFTPADPVAQKATEAPFSSKDTSLESAGYTSGGVYKPQTGSTWRVPQGGAFSYKPKAGQSVSVSSRLVKGMTYEYTVSVLAPDGHTFARHRYTVTYITPATHSARLTGIKVNGKTIPGFDPARLSYDVNVADVNRWTIVPQYDRTLGVTVVTSKDGRTATITVTSADGLVKTVYTVHAHGPASDGGAGADGTGVTVDVGRLLCSPRQAVTCVVLWRLCWLLSWLAWQGFCLAAAPVAGMQLNR